MRDEGERRGQYSGEREREGTGTDMEEGAWGCEEVRWRRGRITSGGSDEVREKGKKGEQDGIGEGKRRDK